MARTLEWDEGAILKSFYSVVSAKSSAFVLPHIAAPPGHVIGHIAAAQEAVPITLTRQVQPKTQRAGDIDPSGTTNIDEERTAQQEDDEAEEFRRAQLELQEAFAGAMSRAATGEVDEEDDEFWAAFAGSNDAGRSASAAGGNTSTAVDPPAHAAATLNETGHGAPRVDKASRKRLREAADLRESAVAATDNAAAAVQLQEPLTSAKDAVAAAIPSCNPVQPAILTPSGVCTGCGCSCKSAGGSPSNASIGLPADLVESISRAATQAVVELLLPPQPPPRQAGVGVGAGSSGGGPSSARLSVLLQAWYQAGVFAGRTEAAAAVSGGTDAGPSGVAPVAPQSAPPTSSG